MQTANTCRGRGSLLLLGLCLCIVRQSVGDGYGYDSGDDDGDGDDTPTAAPTADPNAPPTAAPTKAPTAPDFSGAMLQAVHADAYIADASNPWNLLRENWGWDGTSPVEGVGQARPVCANDCADGCLTNKSAARYHGDPQEKVSPCLCKHLKAGNLGGDHDGNWGYQVMNTDCIAIPSCRAMYNISRSNGFCTCPPGRTFTCGGPGSSIVPCLCLSDADIAQQITISANDPDVMSKLNATTKSFSCSSKTASYTMDGTLKDRYQKYTPAGVNEVHPNNRPIGGYNEGSMKVEVTCWKNGTTIAEDVTVRTSQGGLKVLKVAVSCQMVKRLECHKTTDKQIAFQSIQEAKLDPMTCNRKSVITPLFGDCKAQSCAMCEEQDDGTLKFDTGFGYGSDGSCPTAGQIACSDAGNGSPANGDFVPFGCHSTDGRSNGYYISEHAKKVKAIEYCTPFGAQW